MYKGIHTTVNWICRDPWSQTDKTATKHNQQLVTQSGTERSMSLLVPEPSPGGGLIMIQQEQHIAMAINTNIGASTAGQFQFTVWSTLTIMKMIGNSRTINIKKINTRKENRNIHVLWAKAFITVFRSMVSKASFILRPSSPSES